MLAEIVASHLRRYEFYSARRATECESGSVFNVGVGLVTVGEGFDLVTVGLALVTVGIRLVFVRDAV